MDTDRIQEPIIGLPLSQLDLVEVIPEIESTNTYLLEQPAPPAGKFRVAIAERQTAGRGRMNKHWNSPGNSGLSMSISYTFCTPPTELSCITLAAGVSVAHSLEELGVSGIGLKWPNDLIVRDSKLGGILTELRSSRGADTTVVIGLGINVDFRGVDGADGVSSRLGRVIDLATCLVDLPTRSEVSALMIETIAKALLDYESEGFVASFDAWRRFDWLRGQRISAEIPEGWISGVCQGIDLDGSLIVQTRNGKERVVSGSIHLDGYTGRTNK